MKILITGASGFIGPHLVRRLISDGHECRCLARSRKKSEPLELLGAEIIEGDITQAQSLKGIAGGMNCLMHLATLGHMSNFTVTEAMFEAVNVLGTLNIMTEALREKVARIVHCSSVAAMGICPEVPATEKSECRPHHSYGRSKLKAERAVLDMVRTHGLPASIIRFSMVYGPGDWRDMLKLVRLARKGMFPKIGSRPKLTPMIHVDDAVQGILLAAEKGIPGEIYLITNKQSEPFDRIRQILQEGLGIRRVPLYIPEWLALLAATMIEKSFTCVGKTPPVARKNIESTLADRVFSIEKARQELGFNPTVDSEAGLKETVAWYLENKWI
ncbi:NAD-dependent epimerase/dehydratase family protein [Desulfococcus sp.]|uniref:NAD-dependent epimerase/dehydratase family protein n=1 Tax=Desulfococcus sp. TaxID=2025834 RepID=UPI003593330C